MPSDLLIPVDKIRPFKLSDSFLQEFEGKQPNWGYDGLGYLTYKRTYARKMEDDRTEEFWQTCKRVVEGVFNIQKAHCYSINVPFNNGKAQRSSHEMFRRMWDFKWLPPGRGLWSMGTDYIYTRGSAPLFNCGFISTKDIKNDYSEPFCWSMDMSMLGVGTGFDTRGSGTMKIVKPRQYDDVHVIRDSREGWVEVLKRLLDAYSGLGGLPRAWDESQVRPAGSILKTFGGVASGPRPLLDMIDSLIKLYDTYIDKPVDSRLIVDTMNISGKCVVSGGIRRTSQIALGDPEDIEFLNLKNPELFPELLSEYRWASNNSPLCKVGMDYDYIAERIAKNGEPGATWLENALKYGRIIDGPAYKDRRVLGFNPCGEIGLESGETCNVVETFPFFHENAEDYRKTLKYAYMYAKTVTLVPTHSAKTNAVSMRNRRIGLSQSGIVQAIDKFGITYYLNEICDNGFKYLGELDKVYSDFFCIPISIKRSCVKPSGTVSLLAGATPGIHRAHSRFYIRRIRVADTSLYWKRCQEAGYHVEDDTYADNTKVIEFPIAEQYSGRFKKDVTMWEQVTLAARLQEYWADNQVSATVTFNKEEGKDIKHALDLFQDRLKGISFLPTNDSTYAQAPYEEITEEQYLGIMKNIRPLDLSDAVHEVTEKFCDGDSCLI